MININVNIKFLLFFILFYSITNASIASPSELKRLEKAYPDAIQAVYINYIQWKDGTRMPIRGSFSFFDQWMTTLFHLDTNIGSISKEDVKRDRFEPFFRKMYGNSAEQVKKNLVTVYWMPNVFGRRYPLRVTTINGVDKKLRRISAALEKLPPSYYKYLANPAGGFYWRNVSHESYLSAHSFGIAIDINSSYSNYWLWDLQRSKKPMAQLTYQNRIPAEIVSIFEKEGFFWGGRWYFYDTMHFEYRPDLFITS